MRHPLYLVQMHILTRLAQRLVQDSPMFAIARVACLRSLPVYFMNEARTSPPLCRYATVHARLHHLRFNLLCAIHSRLSFGSGSGMDFR